MRGRLLSLLILSLALAACGPRPERPTPESARVVPAPAGTPYAVVADESTITLLVYRAGPMARLGHNHVILARTLRGTVWAGDDPTAAAFDVHLPVADMVVDQSEARLTAGADFPGEISPADIDGTRHNLLGEDLLDAADNPEIRLESIAIATAAAGYQVRARVTVKALANEITFPASIVRSPQQIIAEGEFALRQSQLGLKPFSIMLGALQVQDEFRVKFHIVALAPARE